MASPSSFTVTDTSHQSAGNTLVVGQAHLGMAGVTAVDYLVRHMESTQIGHISPEELPAITPFEEGIPRHHSRLYDLTETELLVLVDELFIPVTTARSYTEAVLDWVEDQDVDEIVVLHGVPFPHGPEEHDVFYVATSDYRESRLADESYNPLKGGFLDGVVGEFVMRNLDDAAPETGVFVTPTHPPGPDVDAALLLLDAIESLYGFDVDETELRDFGEQLKQHYEQLAERMAAMAEGDESLASHDYPEDRMFM